jgi:hypothetical protein
MSPLRFSISAWPMKLSLATGHEAARNDGSGGRGCPDHGSCGFHCKDEGK